MLTRKHCPKCTGNIYLGADYYGRYEQCLQCGYIYDLDNGTNALPKQAPQRKEKLTVR